MKRRTTRCSNRPNELIRRQGTMYIMSTDDNTTDLINLHTTQCRASITSRRRPGLILTSYRFPLSLLFHNHRSLPVPIRGYHLQTLITLHKAQLLYLGFFLPPLSSLLLQLLIICPYSCYISVYCTISSYTGLCYPRQRHAYTAATHNAII